MRQRPRLSYSNQVPARWDLHGPGVKWNLVPMTAKTNSAMANEPEKLAKRSVFEENKTLYYKTTVTFHNDNEPIKFFPAKIDVMVGEIVGNENKNLQRFSFYQDKPPKNVEGVVYNLNTIGRELQQAWGDGDGKFGCFLREPGDFPPKIYFYDSGAYFPMNTSLKNTLMR